MLSTSVVFVSRAGDLYVTNRPDRRGGLEPPRDHGEGGYILAFIQKSKHHPPTFLQPGWIFFCFMFEFRTSEYNWRSAPGAL
jgi:hypothetical protein